MSEVRTAPVRLSQSGSMLLDVVRFGAALVVVAHHLCDSNLGARWVKLGVVGYHAVCVFFVLSGFVIRFVTVSRPTSGAEYAKDRASRLYSVMVPALVFTVVCEALARLVNPAVYALVREPFLWRQVPMQLVASLTFTSQLWGHNISPLSNDPFWSMSFEAIYYAVYGLVLYRVRGWWFWSAFVLLVAGPNIAALGLTWALGAGTVDVYLLLKRARHGVAIAWGMVVALALLLSAAWRPLVAGIHAFDHEFRLKWMTEAAAGWSFVPTWAKRPPVPWIAEISPSFLVLAVVTAAVMLAVLLTVDGVHPELPPGLTRRVRWVANGTFALYLFHVPALMLAVCVMGHPVRTVWGGVVLCAGVVVVAIYAAVWMDGLKGWIRKAVVSG